MKFVGRLRVVFEADDEDDAGDRLEQLAHDVELDNDDVELVPDAAFEAMSDEEIDARLEEWREWR